MSVEVCPQCDIAGCHHIRDRQAEADAYLAGETDPVAAEIQRDMLTHSDFRAPPAPKPVTWPDGVTKMTIGPHQITIDAETGVIQVVWHGSVGSTPAQARQLAALLLAAADKAEGAGMTTIAQRLADIAADPLPRMNARQIIETRLGRSLGPIATMPRDLRRALYLLALQLVRKP